MGYALKTYLVGSRGGNTCMAHTFGPGGGGTPLLYALYNYIFVSFCELLASTNQLTQQSPGFL